MKNSPDALASTQRVGTILFLENEKALKKALATIEEAGGRILHQFGRILITNLGKEATGILKQLPRSTKIIEAQDREEGLLTRTETLGLRAFRKRSADDFQSIQTRSLGDNRLWEDGEGHQHSHRKVLKATTPLALSSEEILPVPERLINKNTMAVVIVDSNQAGRNISDTEKVNIVSELQEAMEWIENLRPTAKVTWNYQVYETTVNITPWAGAPFRKMPDAWYDGWDASVNNSNNGAIYAFRGSEYIRFSNLSNGMDAGYPKPIAGHWKNLPASWEAGSFDAALWREQNQKIYLFKGDQYVRIEPSNFTMDAGYPKPIAGHWKNLPAAFNEGIDLALGHKDNNSIYLFKGDQYVRFSNGSTTMDASYPKPIAGNWKELPDSFAEDGMNAAFWRDSNSKIYLFRNSRWGAKYVRMTPDDFTVEENYRSGLNIGLDKNGAEALWRDPALQQLGMPTGHDGGRQLAAEQKASTNSDHAITVYITKQPVVHFAYAGSYRWTLSQSNLGGNLAKVMAHETMHLFGAPDEYLTTSSCTKKYGRFFTATNGNSKACKPSPDGDNCIMRNNAWAVCDFTKLHLGWGPFETQIDAIVDRGDTNYTYVFSGDRYIRYTDISSGRDEGYPRKIAGAWKGMPASFRQGIDAAVWLEENEALYFFKGSQYVRFSKGKTTMDAGYPRSISGAWKNLPVAFEQKIDGGFWRKSNDKIYLFSGNQYVRMSMVNGSPTMDATYPRSIASAWKGLPGSFEQGISAALMRRDTNQMYLFRGGRYVRYSGLASAGIDNNYPAWIHKNWMPFPRNY